jgi:transposase
MSLHSILGSSPMARKPGSSDPKATSLREHGCLNPGPESVRDPLFSQGDFFDSRDTIQVKYEMLRRVRVDGHSIADSVRAFGFSRPSFYQAQQAFDSGGLPALLPKKPGPHGGHKLGSEVVAWLFSQLENEPGLSSLQLAERVAEEFALLVHPRSIERALARQKKKRQ